MNKISAHNGTRIGNFTSVSPPIRGCGNCCLKSVLLPPIDTSRYQNRKTHFYFEINSSLKTEVS